MSQIKLKGIFIKMRRLGWILVLLFIIPGNNPCLFANESDFQLSLKKAESGDSGEQFKVAIAYHYGKGVSKDFDKEMYWLEKASKNGHMEAQSTYGFYLVFPGPGREVNVIEGMHWLIIAESKGDESARHNIEKIMRSGLVDTEKEIAHLRELAESGYVPAQYYLAESFSEDDEESFWWYKKASEGGDVRAQAVLSAMYFEGNGTKQNYRKAFDWAAIAAKNGHELAQLNLAVFYINGYGTIPDIEQAYAWTLIAASNGSKEAQQRKSDLESKLPSETISRGRNLAKNIWSTLNK